MAGKPAITKAEILDVAYARAQQDGLGASPFVRLRANAA